MDIRSLSYQNQFAFVCPIFGAETKMGVCMYLRDRVWRGDRPEVRKGCQACLVASKCPIVTIIQGAQLRNEDLYFSAEPKKGHLLQRHLDRIRAIIVPEGTMDRFGVPSAERMAIEAANGLKGVLKGKADTGAGIADIPEYHERKAPVPISSKRKTPEKAPVVEPGLVVSNSYADAINEAMKETK